MNLLGDFVPTKSTDFVPDPNLNLTSGEWHIYALGELVIISINLYGDFSSSGTVTLGTIPESLAPKHWKYATFAILDATGSVVNGIARALLQSSNTLKVNLSADCKYIQGTMIYFKN